MTVTHRIDRSDWGKGPWDAEPDDVRQWVGPGGLPCMVARNILGAWCGYVALPDGHPWHGLASEFEEPLPMVEVHGGITFTGRKRLAPGEHADAYWIGFDCAHGSDRVPLENRSSRQFRVALDTFLFGAPVAQEYRTQVFAERETEKLARQVIAAGEVSASLREVFAGGAR